MLGLDAAAWLDREGGQTERFPIAYDKDHISGRKKKHSDIVGV